MSDTAIIERSATGAAVASLRGQYGWALFEWARAPYVALIAIYVFAPYFTNTVIGDPVQGQSYWSLANTLAGFLLGFLAPITGAMSDRMGRRKPWLVAIAIMMTVCCIALWWVKPPGEGGWPLPVTVMLIILLAAGFAAGEVFHNAMLPAIVPTDRIGWLSGMGLAINNLGAMFLLAAVLALIALPASDTINWGFLPDRPWFGLDPARHEHERIAGPIAGIWLILFHLPLLLWTPDSPSTGIGIRRAVGEGWRQLVQTVRCARQIKNVGLYLLARTLFTDGVVAIIVYAGIYASGYFKWDVAALLIFGLLLTPAGVLGGLMGGWVDGRIGSKRGILISVGGCLACMVVAISITPHSILFWIPYDAQASGPLWDFPYYRTLPEALYVANFIVLVVFIGAIFATSRAMMARIAPLTMLSQFFGLYAVSGWATAFVGHGLVALFTTTFHSQRAGFGSTIILLTIGLLLMTRVREERAPDIRID